MLTSVASGEGPIEGAHEVVRTKDALTSGLNWRRGQFAALGGASDESYKPPSRLASVVVPDLSLGTWLPFALPAARRLARERHFDCVLTTSPPPSTHLVGLVLRRRGTPWIAELRDGWTFEPPHPAWPLRLQHSADRALERQVPDPGRRGRGRDAADRRGHARTRLGVEALLIANGYDPDDDREAPRGGRGARPGRPRSSTPAGSRSRTTSLSRCSTGSHRSGRSPVAARLEVVFAGSVTNEERACAGGSRPCRHRPLRRLARARAGARPAAGRRHAPRCDRGRRRRSVATGKLFEYLGRGTADPRPGRRNGSGADR